MCDIRGILFSTSAVLFMHFSVAMLHPL